MASILIDDKNVRVTSTANAILGDPAAPRDSESWAIHWRCEMRRYAHAAKLEPRLLRHTYEDGAAVEAWRKLRDDRGRPFASFDEFCRTRKPQGLNTDPNYVRKVIALAKGEAAAAAITAPELKEHGRPKEKGDNITFSKAKPNQDLSRGTSSEYRAARLRRDAPEVYAKVARGEYPSMAEAWRDAGLEKKPDPVVTIARKLKKLPPKDRVRAVLQAFGVTTPSELANVLSKFE